MKEREKKQHETKCLFIFRIASYSLRSRVKRRYCILCAYTKTKRMKYTEINQKMTPMWHLSMMVEQTTHSYFFFSLSLLFNDGTRNVHTMCGTGTNLTANRTTTWALAFGFVFQPTKSVKRENERKKKFVFFCLKNVNFDRSTQSWRDHFK